MNETSLQSPVAEGRTAEIYPWGETHILKLYRAWCPPDWVEYEARIAASVHKAGIPSPAAGEIVDVDGRRGLVYERIEGPSMLQEMNARPWTFLNHARSLADLHVKIHKQTIEGLPSYRNRLRFDIRRANALSEALREKALRLLEALPDGGSVCHGDFHPGNVLLTREGPVVIDWMTACSGVPAADVARTSLLLSIGAKSAGNMVRPLLRIVISLYHRTYMNRYQTNTRGGKHEPQRWMPVIAAARLNEEILPEREALIQMVAEG
jgi:Ser/Thr protein kinase RdoA (MazF antagonist)